MKDSILLIDDTFASRRVAKRLLKKLGYENIHEAHNGRQASSMLKHSINFTFVLSDFFLGDSNILDVLRSLQEEGLSVGSPLVLMSSDIPPSTLQEGRELGVSAVLRKPFSADTLQDTVDEILNRVKSS